MGRQSAPGSHARLPFLPLARTLHDSKWSCQPLETHARHAPASDLRLPPDEFRALGFQAGAKSHVPLHRLQSFRLGSDDPRPHALEGRYLQTWASPLPGKWPAAIFFRGCRKGPGPSDPGFGAPAMKGAVS